jgi:hypothetical protein
MKGVSREIIIIITKQSKNVFNQVGTISGILFSTSISSGARFATAVFFGSQLIFPPAPALIPELYRAFQISKQ